MVEITNKQEKEYHIVQITGEVDASSSIYLDNAISECVSKGAQKILVDGRDLEYISSAGLGVFMSYLEDFKEKDIRMVLFGLSEKVNNVFQILGLDRLMAIEETEEEAKEKVDEVQA